MHSTFDFDGTVFEDEYVISNGNSASEDIPVNQITGTAQTSPVHETLSLCGVFIPAAFDGAALFIQEFDETSSSWVRIVDPLTGADYEILFSSNSRYVPIDVHITAGCKVVRLESDQVETGDRTLRVRKRRIE